MTAVKKFTVTTSKTIQDFAKNLTGSVAHATTLMSLNKLSSQNLKTGQVIAVPVNLISPSAQARISTVSKATSDNKAKLALLGAALLGAAFYMKKKGGFKFA